MTIQRNNPSPPKAHGWITPLIANCARSITWPIEKWIIGRRDDAQDRPDEVEDHTKRAKKVDWYVAMCLCIELLLFVLIVNISCAPDWFRWIVLFPLFYKIVEINAYASRVSIFDRVIRLNTSSFVASKERIVILGFVNYLELIICFACIYAAHSSLIKGPQGHTIDWFDSVYLSAITQFTIGYGDLAPTSILRLFAVIQGISSILLLVLLIGRFISLIDADRSLANPTAPKKPQSSEGNEPTP